MTKTDNRHYNRKAKRLLALEMDYFCAYNGKVTEFGKIEDVRYVGNTVYGRVYLKIKDQWYVMLIEKSKPSMNDLKNAYLVACNEPTGNNI